MKFETMGYRDLERSQRRIETNEHNETFRELLLPGEKWEDLTWEEQSERIEADENGTIQQLLDKKLKERRRDTDRVLEEARESKSQKVMMEIERMIQEMQDKLNRKQNIEQKVVDGEFVETTDSNMTSIQERKSEQMARETSLTEPNVEELTDLPIRNTNSAGTVISNVAFPTQESKLTEPLITEFYDEEILDIPQLNQKTNKPSISKLDDFAKMIEAGQLSLEDAIEYLDLDDIEDIVESRGSNDMDLLQIAISNNYGNLYNQIINGIDIENIKIRHVPGYQYARINGSSISLPPRRRKVTQKEHINLFNKFDIFRKDSLGQSAFSYALNNNNQDMFYSMVAKCNDSKLVDMTFKSPMLSDDWPEVDLLSFLMDSYVRNNDEKLFSTIETVIQNKELYEKLFFGDGYTIQNLIEFDISNYPIKNGEKSIDPASKLLDLILSTSSKEERTYIWQYIVGHYFEDKQLMKSPVIKADNLLNFMNKMLQNGVDIERKDLDVINSVNFNITDFDKFLGADKNLLSSVNQKRDSLFNCDISRLETLTGKSPDVLKAVLGENYLEQLKAMIEKEPTNINAFINAINSKYWHTEGSPRMYMFKNIRELIAVPNEEGHTLFASLTSEKIVEIFNAFNPVLSNEAIMDLADKPIFKDTNGKLAPWAVLKVYDAVYDYVPTGNIEDFCSQMLSKIQNKNGSLFDFSGRYDDSYRRMHKLEYEMIVQELLERFDNTYPQNSEYYGNKIQKMQEKAIEKRKAEQQKKSEEKEMYVTMQDLAKQNKDLRAENEQLKIMFAKLQGMENNQDASLNNK